MSQAARRAVGSLLGIIVLLLISCFFETTANAQITMRVFTDPHPVVSGGTIGFAFAGNKFVGSVQGDGLKVLYATDLDGTNVRVFAPTVSVPSGSAASEHYVASSVGLGGFPSRDVYVAAGNGIIHITNDGNSSDVFTTGLSSPVRAIVFDLVGTFGNDMLLATVGGQIYRVNSFGAASLVASIGEEAEGLDVVPVGAHFGSFDGQLVVAAEGSGLLRAISPSGVVTVLNEADPIFYPERLSFVPPDLGASGSSLEGVYEASYPSNVVRADRSEFASFKGDAIVTTELGDRRITRVHWNGTAFEMTVIGNLPGQAEDGLFLTPRMLNPGSCPVTPSGRSGTQDAWCAPFCQRGGRRFAGESEPGRP